MSRRGVERRRLATDARLRLALSVVLASGVGAAGDWPQLRGTARDGRGDPPRTERAAARAGSSALRLAWSQPLGPGYSGVTVAGGVALTLDTDGDRERLVAFDAVGGGLLWDYTIGPGSRSHNGKPSKPPASTPLVHRGVVYALGAHGKLFALRLTDGTEVWSHRIDGRPPVHGHAASPLLVGKALVIAAGGPRGEAVTAYDMRDGSRLWSHGSDRIAYQSPLLAQLAGQRVLLVPGNDLLLGLDPATGDPLFRHRHDADDGDGYGVPVAVPAAQLRGVAAAQDGRPTDGVVLTHRDGAALFVATREARPEAKRGEERWRLRELWRTDALRNSYAAPVVHDGHLYGFGGETLRCIDVATGEELWRERLLGGRGLIVVGDRLVLFAPADSVVIADASPAGYRERARLQVATGGSYTWPSYAGGRIYVRDHRRVAAIEFVEPEAGPPAAATSPRAAAGAGLPPPG